MTIKTIFLDRDGVINKEVNYLHKVEDFEFIEGVFDACNYLKKLGYSFIIVTNQSGIGRGLYDLKEYQTVTKWMLNQFKKNNIKILDIFYCPHDPKLNCHCRKPKPGMFLKAEKKYKIDMANSWMIGDMEGDIKAANQAGIVKTILVRSGHKIEESSSNAKFIINSISQAPSIISA